jgi:F-type H+-transporting ATPase subunit epsilon
MPEPKQLRCQLITPDREVLDTPVTSVVFPAHDGEMGILNNRAPLLCKMGIGICRITSDAGTQKYFVDGGFARMLDNCLTILTEHARTADQINVEATRRELDEARARSARDPAAQKRRRQAIQRAAAQIKLATT